MTQTLPQYQNKAQAKRMTGLSYLGGINTSSKIKKGLKYDEMTYILYLAPAKMSGYEVCSMRSAECTAACLNESGHNRIDIHENVINKARITKTKLFFENRPFFMAWLIDEIRSAQKKAIAAGIAPEKIIIDPGIGFAKEAEHNWELIKRVNEIVELGYPVLIGASRKRFLGGDSPLEREAATLELTKGLVGRGIWGVRVHSVAPHKKVIADV